VLILPLVHLQGPYRAWQRRFDDLNLWSEKKRREKLNYAHGNAMKKGASPLSLVTLHCPFAFWLLAPSFWLLNSTCLLPLAIALLHSDSWLLTSGS
jgi:hypothetical protein